MRIEKQVFSNARPDDLALFGLIGESLVIDPEASVERRLNLLQVFTSEEGSVRFLLHAL